MYVEDTPAIPNRVRGSLIWSKFGIFFPATTVGSFLALFLLLFVLANSYPPFGAAVLLLLVTASSAILTGFLTLSFWAHSPKSVEIRGSSICYSGRRWRAGRLRSLKFTMTLENVRCVSPILLAYGRGAQVQGRAIAEATDPLISGRDTEDWLLLSREVLSRAGLEPGARYLAGRVVGMGKGPILWEGPTSAERTQAPRRP